MSTAETTTAPTTSTTSQVADNTTSHPNVHQQQHQHGAHGDHHVSQMLRLRIIDGHFEGLKSNLDTYAVVSIGKQSARTKVVKNTNHPVFEENFAIGYEIEDAKSEIVIDVFDKGHLTDDRLGEFRLSLAQVHPPKARRGQNRDQTANPTPDNGALPAPKGGAGDAVGKKDKAPKTGESWANAQPQKAVMINRKGDNVGYLTILVRRELRLAGNLNIHVREIDVSPMSDQTFWAKPTSLVAKLGQERHEQALNMTSLNNAGAGQRIPAELNISFVVNDTNNVSDVFFELWQNGQAVAEARLPLYDTRRRYNGSLAFIGPFGGHDVTNTNQKNQIATLFLNSEFQD